MPTLPSPADLIDLAPPGAAVCGVEEPSACGTDGWGSLRDEERGAWESFLQAHAEIQLELERELHDAHRLSFNDYFALLALERAPGRQLRMHDLARPVRLTRSGLTRLVERLERDGLIERLPCPEDARGTEARITDAGRELLHAASATHLAGVKRRFLDRFSAAELRTLAKQLSRLSG